jgi:hypothetical protein
MNRRQKAFLDNYILTNHVSESAIKAGYSAKCPAEIGSRLLRHPEIKAELARIQAEKDAKFNEKKAQLSRENYIETAWKNFESETDPALRPRWFELCGRSLGYLAPKEQAPAVTNNTLVVNMEHAKLTAEERWAKLRNLLNAED